MRAEMFGAKDMIVGFLSRNIEVKDASFIYCDYLLFVLLRCHLGLCGSRRAGTEQGVL